MGTMPKLNWNNGIGIDPKYHSFFLSDLVLTYIQNEICNTTTIDKSFVICEPKNNEFDVFSRFHHMITNNITMYITDDYLLDYISSTHLKNKLKYITC